MTSTAVTRVRPTPLSLLAVAWLIVVDAVNRYSVGPATLSAALTAASLSVIVLVAVTNRRAFGFTSGSTDAEPPPLALRLFALWAVVVVPFHPTLAGLQNVTVYLAFVIGMAVTSRRCTPGASDRLLSSIERGGWLVALVYLASVLKGGLAASTIYGARTFALVALVILAVAVPRGRRLLTLLILVALLVSLSRTATAVGILVLAVGLAVRSGSRGRAFRVVALLVLGLCVGYFAFTHFAPLRDRFLGGDQGFAFGSQRFNGSGRLELWSFTVQSARQHLWFGGGPGSAEAAVLQRFVTVAHPHNDYLRLLHDFGIVGLSLFVIGLVALLRRTWRNGRITGQPVHWAAFLSLVAVAGVAITDNVLVYSFVMIPVGIVVGASLSATRPRHSSDPSTTGADPGASEPAADDSPVLLPGGRWSTGSRSGPVRPARPPGSS